jgi:hypothetical protein
MTLSVDPAELRAAAARCDTAAERAAGVLVSLNAAGAPDTGRGDTRAAVLDAVHRLAGAVEGLGLALTADAIALRRSADVYACTDDASVRVP